VWKVPPLLIKEIKYQSQCEAKLLIIELQGVSQVSQGKKLKLSFELSDGIDEDRVHCQPSFSMTEAIPQKTIEEKSSIKTLLFKMTNPAPIRSMTTTTRSMTTASLLKKEGAVERQHQISSLYPVYHRHRWCCQNI
jgi:hypothetical protein